MFDLPDWILWLLSFAAVWAISWNFALSKKAGKEAEQENGDS